MLDKEAALVQGWELEDPTQLLSPIMIAQLEGAVKQLPARHPARAAYIALMLGQRVADVLRIRSENVILLASQQSLATTLVVKFVETKTSQRCGHFCLALPAASNQAAVLLNDRNNTAAGNTCTFKTRQIW
jgi:hypothetical protein